MTLDEIKKKYESQEVELKKTTSSLREACESLCGMLNTDKGIAQIIFGIDPNYNIFSIPFEDLDKSQKSIGNHVNQKFDPSILPSIEIIEIDGAYLISLKANRSRGISYYEYNGRAFIREGSQVRQLTREEKIIIEAKRNRDKHNGPWKCDKCGAITMNFTGAVFDGHKLTKTYECGCGGEYWPA
jgi:predicted HTH transcriptional regulator